MNWVRACIVPASTGPAVSQALTGHPASETSALQAVRHRDERDRFCERSLYGLYNVRPASISSLGGLISLYALPNTPTCSQEPQGCLRTGRLPAPALIWRTPMPFASTYLSGCQPSRLSASTLITALARSTACTHLTRPSSIRSSLRAISQIHSGPPDGSREQCITSVRGRPDLIRLPRSENVRYYECRSASLERWTETRPRLDR